MGIRMRLTAGAGAAVFVLTVAACGSDSLPPVEPSPAAGSPVLLAAGDIASCEGRGDEATAQLIEDEPGTVATLGDNAYEYGTRRQFSECYGPSWGSFKARTRPALGNHEYATEGAAGYFDYFGGSAGRRPAGWYGYKLGGWRILVLNSNCKEVGGCGERSAQGRWLARQLRQKPFPCTLAYFHHPRFSSGKKHGNTPAVAGLWRILYRHRADVVLSAHDHSYERFRPLSPGARPDPKRGIRQFVVGTGGKSLRPFGSIKPGSVVRNSDTLGILKLVLRPKSYSWKFVPVAGRTFTDTGRGRCH